MGESLRFAGDDDEDEEDGLNTPSIQDMPLTTDGEIDAGAIFPHGA